MNPDVRGALFRLASRVKASPYTKPLARAVLAVGALVILALIGSRAGAMNPAGSLAAAASTAPA
ncbi:MAG: hypothetical protein ACRENE_11795, partial [Polyangiaceae bacterium]